MKQLAAIVVLAGTIAALPHAQQASPAIRGRIVASETGEALPHARVVLYDDATPLPAIFTDGEGRFASVALPDGRYHLSVTKAGYALTRVARLDATSPAGVDVRMPRSGSIAGRVLDANGEPGIGMTVTVTPGPKVVQTNDLGEFRAGGLSAGAYVVALITSQFDPSTGVLPPATLLYPGVTTPAEAQRIVVAPGDQKTGIDFFGVTNQAGTLPQPVNVAKGAGVIRGRITQADGLPLARAAVTTLVPQAAAGPQGPRPQSTATDEDGRYEFAGLPKGEYRIQARKAGFVTTVYGQKTAADRGETVTLTDNQTRTGLDITLPRYSAVAGHILDDYGDPIEGVTVTASQIRFLAGRRRLASVNGAQAQATDDLGRYRLFGLPPGQYVITASVGQVTALAAGAEVSGFAPTYFPGTTNAGDARLVAVPVAQDVEGVDLSLVPLPTARVSGRRLGSDGEPLGGSIVLTPSQRSGAIVTPPTGARLERDGRFEFPNVPPGEYVIQADHGRAGGTSAEGEFVSQFVSVTGADVTDLLLQATPGSTISGRVLFDGDVAPLAQGVRIVPAPADPDRTPLANGSIARADVQQDLTFALSGIHGPRRLQVERPPAGWGLKAVIVRGADVTDAPLPFGTAEQSIADVQIVMTNRLTELSGTVADMQGRASSEYTLIVFPADREQWYPGSRYVRRVSAEAAGHFTVRGLPASDYFVAPVAGLRLQGNGDDSWQEPEFLDSIALRAARATLTDGQKLAISARLITP